METVDAMTLNSAEVPGQLRVVRVLRNGKRWFDPVEKERLIDACLEPGVSVAGLALAHGINANQLRKWVKLRQDREATETACGDAELRAVSLRSGGRGRADGAAAGHVSSAASGTGPRDGVAAERGAA